MRSRTRYPVAVKPERVGRYPALVKSGGGFVWDEVLEYRVWCCPHRGADDLEDGNDYFFAFATYPRALAFSQKTRGADEPIALIRQKEYIDEPRTGQYVHVKKVRLTEWPVEFLECPRRGRHTIPDFLAPDAPANRLDIMRGLARNPRSAATARKTRPRPTRRTLH